MEKICGNCKYKGVKITRIDNETGEDVDTAYFMCDSIKHDNDWKYKQGQKALVTDGSGYMATLCVENDFGCVKWCSV